MRINAKDVIQKDSRYEASDEALQLHAYQQQLGAIKEKLDQELINLVSYLDAPITMENYAVVLNKVRKILKSIGGLRKFSDSLENTVSSLQKRALDQDPGNLSM